MQTTSITRTLLATALAVLLTASFGWGQASTATLEGVVTDSGGGVVPGATVKVEAVATGLDRLGVTNETGLYGINFLPVGRYSVTVEVPGFKTVRLQNILLEIGQTRRLDVKLEVGGIQETIEVVETAPPLDRNSAVIGTVIQSSQVKELPLNGRHWASLMMLRGRRHN